MSQYDFNRCIDRRISNSLKWQAAGNELPMWVADMDFAGAPEITAALANRVQHGVFGYETIPESWQRLFADERCRPRSRLEDGLARLKTGITAYEAWMSSIC